VKPWILLKYSPIIFHSDASEQAADYLRVPHRQDTVNDLSTEELVKCIQDSIDLLENYRMFGPMVEEGIEAFKKINTCVIDPTPEARQEAKDLIGEMQRQIGPYKGMVPQVAEALEKLEKWSKEE
jgi:hypothetical protein